MERMKERQKGRVGKLVCEVRDRPETHLTPFPSFLKQ